MASKPKAKITFDTLSALRPRKIDPKYAALGQMTRMVEAAERKARGPNGGPNAYVNKTTAFLERMANRGPAQFDTTRRNARNLQPIGVQQTSKLPNKPSGLRYDGPPKVKAEPKAKNSGLADALDSLAARRSPTGATGPSSTSDRVSFRRDVASLDRLAASAGIDSSAGAVQKRRSYADKVAERQRGTTSVPGKGTKTGTRFALPAQTATGGRRAGAGPRRGPGGARKAGESGNRPARAQSKVQLDEAERQRRIEARRAAGRPAAINYEAPDLEQLTAQLALDDAKQAQESGWASYKAVAKLLQQGHDATTLVAMNRSIVPKRVVLQKISGWLPEVTPVNRPNEPRTS